MGRQVILDTETTGLDSKQGHRIIEIACLEMVGRRVNRDPEYAFYKRLNPERDIDEGATQVHGITLDDLTHEPKFADIAEHFLDYVRGAELIIHNAPFDVGFINAELARVGKAPITEICTITDTLAMARELHPGKKNSLDALCERYAIDNSSRTFHGALLDTELLADVYVAMTRGQDSLAIGLELAGGKSPSSAVTTARPAKLKVLRANADELRQHLEHIEHLDATSGGKAVWKVI